MAEVKANGVVKRIIEGYGFVLEESFQTRDGESRSKFFTVWDKAYAEKHIAQGDRVQVSGLLTVKIEEFTGRDGDSKQVAAAHINNPTTTADNPF
ncbi:MAG TPA: hypothetical protein VKP88_04710 [Candidatus Paceibacterota bacterium]|nr:hypothetical protein [Candidatus Paceibacterota bacterium]